MSKSNNSNNKIKCNLCYRGCLLDIGEVGFCGVIMNENSKLKNLQYGRILLNKLVRGKDIGLFFLNKDAKILKIGFVGCNFRCSFCQTWDTSLLPVIKAKECGRKCAINMIKAAGCYRTPEQLVKY
jgi:pyruvate formate lyase activating enzyme